MTTKRYVILAKCYDKQGKLLSSSFNSYKRTHPIQKYFAEKIGIYNKEYIHAEIGAILKCKGKPIYRITIERYNSEGKPMLAKPCLICQEAIKAFGIKLIEYTE